VKGALNVASDNCEDACDYDLRYVLRCGLWKNVKGGVFLSLRNENKVALQVQEKVAIILMTICNNCKAK
jgi:hypothetical protein